MILILVSGKYQVRISNRLCVAEALSENISNHSEIAEDHATFLMLPGAVKN